MTPTETTVSAICAGILGLDRVGVDDDLFDLGSDSHQAVLVALEIEHVFSVDLPLEILESSANVRALAAWIDARRARSAPPAAGRGAPVSDD